jgi:outer membrane scaffolding protein for murein synthesis (MipA/OmpV family)
MTRTSALPLALVLLAAGALQAAEDRLLPQNWSVTVGGGAVVIPSYSGASSFRIMPWPLINARYRDLFFLNAATGAGVNVLYGPRGRAGFAVKPDFGRNASWGDRLRGWGDIGASADLSMFGAVNLFPVTVQAELHRQLGAGMGMLAIGSVSSFLPVGRFLSLVPSARLTWADRRYTGAYYSVTTEQAQIARTFGNDLPSYATHAGLRDVGFSLNAIVPFDAHWSMTMLGSMGWLLGDAARSPLTQRRFQPAFGGFLGYKF